MKKNFYQLQASGPPIAQLFVGIYGKLLIEEVKNYREKLLFYPLKNSGFISNPLCPYP